MSQQPYYVLEIHRPGQPPETRSINAHRQVLGRDGGDIPLHDQQASAMHAEIEFEDGQMVVRDLGSSNGTWKGERSLPQFAMSQGEEFRIGATRLRVAQIVGGQQLQAGGTVMGDANMLAQVKAQQAAMMAQGGASVAAPASPAKSGLGAGAVIGIALAVLVVVGGGGFAAYMLLLSGGEDTEVAHSDATEDETKDVDEPETPETPAAPPEEDEPVVEKDLGQLYKDVGAATVLIRVPGSVGSGAIVDSQGIILTNNHVIDHGERDGLTIKAKVTLGQFNEESQAFEPVEEPLDAYVLKVDADHDLALIGLVEPPADLPSISLADEKPYPGQKVAAVGHAGAGLLWAIKGGEIASTGKLSGHTQLALEEASGFEADMLKRMKEQMDKQGRVIQSTAKILPGDSGGPLVDPKGRLVGVNAFGRIDRATGQWLSFHVHLAEVQEFMKEIPTKRLEHIPDPWELKEADTKFVDVDIDGQIDTLLVSSLGGLGGSKAYFFDLDENSVDKGGRPPKWEELTDVEEGETRAFDPELIVLHQDHTRHFWYDTDNDDQFDRYLIDGGGGHVTEAYALAKDQMAKRDDSLIIDDGLDAGVFENSELQERFQTVGAKVFPGAVDSGSGSKLPDPLAAPGSDGLEGVDFDEDGTWEVYSEQTMFHERKLWDLDQNGAGTTGGTGRELAEGKADIEVVMILQRPRGWVWYDTDGDRAMDLVLESNRLDQGVATAAYTISGSGSLRPAFEHMGQRLFRPDLLRNSTMAKRLRGSAADVLPGALAPDDGLGRFPSPSVTTRGSVVVRDIKRFPNAVAEVTEDSQELVLVDIDRSSVKGKKNQAETAKLVRAGKFDAEFVFMRSAGMAWAFYDTDDDGSFDLVLVSPTGSSTPRRGFKVAGKKLESTDPGPKMVQWGRFDDEKLQKKFSKIATEVWGEQAVE
jgi:S1-C subfamily serine protease